MKKILVILSVFFLGSCDDGDIIVTSFDFEEQTLQTCTDFDFVYFKINPDNNETLALQFSTTLPFQTEQGERQISLSSSNQVTYRRFNSNVTASYFCNAIPPTEPTVVEEFTSNVGDITLVTDGTLDDGDGIPAELEMGMDTDNDGIENHLDFDDDGDNVPTLFEGVVITDGAIDPLLTKDTDGDGIFDYLDKDDDGDGTLTINEDANMDLDPMNDNSDPNMDTIDDYLNPAIDATFDIQAFRAHETIFDDIEITIMMTNLDFRNENGDEVIRNTTTIRFGVFEGTPATTLISTPDFVMN